MLFALLAPIKTPLKYNDEGFAVFNAVRVMDGDVPFKDFWSVYPPGQAYALAAVFQVFGTTLLVARIYDTALRFLIVIALYLISRKITTRGAALLACVVATIFLANSSFYSYPAFPALAFGLLGFWGVLKQADNGRRRWLAAGGALIGFASFFRWDFALYICIGALVEIVLDHVSRNRRKEHPAAERIISVGCRVTVFLGSLIATVLPFYGYVLFRSGINELWEQVVIFPATVLHQTRWRPYPPIIPRRIASAIAAGAFERAYRRIVPWLQFYVPLAGYAAALGHYGLMGIRKRMSFNTQEVTVIAAAVIGLLLFAQALSRYDFIHVMPTSIISAIIIIYLFKLILNYIDVNIAKYLITFLMFVFGCMYMGLPAKTLIDSCRGYLLTNCYSTLWTASCVYINKNHEDAIKYIKNNVYKGESIFVGNTRHDIIFGNDVSFYFLSECPCVTKYHMLHPGVATTYTVQKDIVYDIELKETRFIVLVDYPVRNEPNASSTSSGVHLLDKYIRSNYLRVAEFGNYGIWKRLAAS